MTEEKECGYKVGDVYFHKLKGFDQLWNSTDVATKDMIVNEVGALVKKLHLHGVSKCESIERRISVCVAPEHIKPCRHSFSTICQYNGHCNFKQTDC